MDLYRGEVVVIVGLEADWSLLGADDVDLQPLRGVGSYGIGYYLSVLGVGVGVNDENLQFRPNLLPYLSSVS